MLGPCSLAFIIAAYERYSMIDDHKKNVPKFHRITNLRVCIKRSIRLYSSNEIHASETKISGKDKAYTRLAI